MNYQKGQHNQLYMLGEAPTGDKILTTEGWQDKQKYDEALTAISTIQGALNIAVGTAYEPIQAGALSITGSGFIDNGSANNNEVKYTGVMSGANHWKFEAKIVFSSSTIDKDVQLVMCLNDVVMPCSDFIIQTVGSGKKQTGIMSGCGQLATNDVIALKYKSDDGAVLTVESVRWMATQMR